MNDSIRHCPNCQALMVKQVDENLGQTWLCVDCEEEIEVYF